VCGWQSSPLRIAMVARLANAAQRARLPGACWLGTVPGGVDIDAFTLRREPGRYLVFLGVIRPDQRLELAIEVARAAGRRLVIAGRVGPADHAYYDQVIEPLIRGCPQVEVVGEVNEWEKDALLGNAQAFISLADPPGGSSLALLEALATGTPVVGLRTDASAEIVDPGVNGFVCASLVKMVEEVERAGSLDRAACRLTVERRFSPTAMANAYEQMYVRLLEGPVPWAVGTTGGRHDPPWLRGQSRDVSWLHRGQVLIPAGQLDDQVDCSGDAWPLRKEGRRTKPPS
jgi:glycosyltransferase involved in cell wall biosynthesis